MEDAQKLNFELNLRTKIKKNQFLAEIQFF